MAKVLNFYKEGLKIPDGAVYIGRRMVKHGLSASKFANPFRLSDDEPRGATIERYRHWLWENIRSGKITEKDLLALEGKDVVCYCHPAPCHGDVVVKAVEWAIRRRDERLSSYKKK
ncbi:hypothetical protein KASHIRA_00170 [Serratia phage vB_SmaM-Kashira]|nr:hypothetical protein KASHIRA_00170 [Serratia phage vB_SmaM-Kashira]